MSSLDRKLFRDLAKLKGQSIAACLVMACGLAMMIMTRSLVVSLESARSSYYHEYRFADIFCGLKRAPNALRARLAEISGVAAVETQVVGALRLHLSDDKEIVHGTIVSLPGAAVANSTKSCLRADAFRRTEVRL